MFQVKGKKPKLSNLHLICPIQTPKQMQKAESCRQIFLFYISFSFILMHKQNKSKVNVTVNYKLIHHSQLGFIPWRQGWFYSRNSINSIHSNNILVNWENASCPHATEMDKRSNQIKIIQLKRERKNMWLRKKL